jgi:hypothetical protein
LTAQKSAQSKSGLIDFWALSGLVRHHRKNYLVIWCLV